MICPERDYEYSLSDSCIPELADEMLSWENATHPLKHDADFWLDELPSWMPRFYRDEFIAKKEVLNDQCSGEELDYLEFLGTLALYPDRIFFPGYPPIESEMGEAATEALHSIIAIKKIEFQGKDIVSQQFSTQDNEVAISAYTQQKNQCLLNNENRTQEATRKRQLYASEAYSIRKEHPSHSKFDIARILQKRHPECTLDYLRRLVPEKLK